MNNKKLGTAFERKMCEILSSEGYWVHFIVPDARGAQPFDIVAVRFGEALAIDCKTSSTYRFNLNRLEDNQRMAFNRWIQCGNSEPIVAVLYQNRVYMIPYNRLVRDEVINLKQEDYKCQIESII